MQMPRCPLCGKKCIPLPGPIGGVTCPDVKKCAAAGLRMEETNG